MSTPVECPTCRQEFSSKRLLSAHLVEPKRCVAYRNEQRMAREHLVRCPGAFFGVLVLKNAGVLIECLVLEQGSSLQLRARTGYEPTNVAPFWAVKLHEALLAANPITDRHHFLLAGAADRVKREPGFAEQIEVLLRLTSDPTVVLSFLNDQGIQ